MARNIQEAIAAVNNLETELKNRAPQIEKTEAYYRGDHKLRYASEEFREWFEKQFKGFADNWCKPVADAPIERMKIEGILPHGADKVDLDLQLEWEKNRGTSESKLGFSTAGITGRSFALVWPGDDGPEMTFEHPSQAIVGYEPGSRFKRKYGMKLWSEGDKKCATLYADDFVWKLEKKTPKTSGKIIVVGGDPEEEKWQRREVTGEPWPLPNPLGVVPMVELPNQPDLKGGVHSDIEGVIAMQDAINSLWSFLFTAADFAALPQRVILGAQLPKVPVLNDQGQKVGEKPVDLPEANVKRILNLEGPNAKIDSWDAANLEVFTGTIEKCVGHVASQTRTPIYYFASSIQNISGDSLQALDSGLCAKISDLQVYSDDPIKEIYALLAIAMGQREKAKAIRAGTVMWADHESRTEAQRMDKLVKMQTIGFPQRYIFETYTGGDADEVERIMNMRQDEAENDPLSLLGQTLQGTEDQAAGQGAEQAAEDASKRGATGGADNGGSGSGHKVR